MLNHLIYESSEAGTARLIRRIQPEPDAKSDQAPVLCIERGGFWVDFGPSDILDDPWNGSHPASAPRMSCSHEQEIQNSPTTKGKTGTCFYVTGY